MMSRFFKFLILLSLIGSSLGAEMVPLRLYSFKRGDDWNERSLPQAVEWMPLGKRELASLRSSCRAFYDEEAVSFILELDERQPALADTVEIWLKPPAQNACRQFIIGRDGALSRYLRDGGGVEVLAAGGESLEVSKKAGVWRAVLRVPFATLNAALPIDNERWGFNVCRHWRGEGGVEELSSWAEVSAFDQVKYFGELAFYSRADVDADLAYWEGGREDENMRRSRVAGLAIALQRPENATSFWRYDPFAGDESALRGWKERGLTTTASAGLLGKAESAEGNYPDLFRTADSLNRAILLLSRLELRLDELHRMASYHADTPTAVEAVRQKADGLGALLNEHFLAYSAVFPSQEAGEWTKVEGEIASYLKALEECYNAVVAVRDAWQRAVQEEAPWSKAEFAMAPDEVPRSASGAPMRFWFSAYALYPGERAADYFGPFRSWNVNWPFLLLERSRDGAWSAPHSPLVSQRWGAGGLLLNAQTGVGLVSYQGPTSEWLEGEIARDHQILARTQDELEIPRQRVGALEQSMRRGVNISHPKVRAYYREYLAELVRGLEGRGDFLLTGWEARTEIRHWDDGKIVTRLRGYDSFSKEAFRGALLRRYSSVEELNRRWGGTRYESFEEIEPPPDRWVAGRGRSDGLHYEWARWQVESHMEWGSFLREAIRREAPEVPVMTDSPHLLLQGAAWKALQAKTADILSFHYNPTNEEAMFAYLQSLARRKGVPLACFENYSMMYSRLEGDDERVGARTLRRHLFDLAARDVRMQSYWLGYMGQAPSYVAAYGGGVFRLDTGQTLLRWPAAEMHRYRLQLEVVERALVASAPELGRIAIFIPDSTFIQAANLQEPAKEEVPMARFTRFQKEVLSEASLPAEYVHEEMLEEDGGEELRKYETLVVLDAAFVTLKVLRAIRDWAAEPGHRLVISGPFGFFDECGLPHPVEASPQRVVFPQLSVEAMEPWRLRMAAPEPGRPWIKKAAFGGGQVLQLLQPVGAFLERLEKRRSLVHLLEGEGGRTVEVKGEGLRYQYRMTAEGERYLLINNRDVYTARTYEALLPGDVVRARDIAIPGGFPVPVETVASGGRLIRGSLQPGDWTLIQLE